MTTGTPVVVSRIQNRRGTQEQFDNLYPTYPGSGPNILQPGEIALCTDTRRVFVGNLNGEYVELAVGTVGPVQPLYTPVQVVLSPSGGSFFEIPALSYSSTPFLSIMYSLVDVTGFVTTMPALPTAVGTALSRNGELKITATAGTAMLVDTATEINSTPYEVSFKADYIDTNTIGVSYSHNFPGNLTFSTYTIVWAPL